MEILSPFVSSPSSTPVQNSTVLVLGLCACVLCHHLQQSAKSIILLPFVSGQQNRMFCRAPPCNVLIHQKQLELLAHLTKLFSLCLFSGQSSWPLRKSTVKSVSVQLVLSTVLYSALSATAHPSDRPHYQLDIFFSYSRSCTFPPAMSLWG